MNTHTHHLLQTWYPLRHDKNWVLGTIVKTEGSAYRKAGAMMLFNDDGQYFGLLSGGCLESDLHKKAMYVLHQGKASTFCYDSTEQDSEAYQLGLGCGGIVEILLEPILPENNYLNLEQVLMDLNANIMINSIAPMPKLLVFGGGADAQSLVAMASLMSLQVTVVDPRVAYARPESFSSARLIEKCHPNQIATKEWFNSISLVIIMMHSTELDAAALNAVSQLPLDYCALLGPIHRKQEVLELVGITEEELAFDLSSPAGLDIGASLPEEIAISILAEYLQQRTT